MGKKIEFRLPPSRSKQPTLSDAEKEKLARQFIAAAPLSSQLQARTPKLKEISQSDKKIQSFKLRLPSDQFSQLQKLSKLQSISINSLIINLLRPAIRKALQDN